MKRLISQLSSRRRARNFRYVSAAMALMAAITTVAILMLPAFSITYKTQELDCPYEVHQHTDACYNADQILTCGYADYVIHQHTEDCYKDGELVCTLPEIPEHRHTGPAIQKRKG